MLVSTKGRYALRIMLDLAMQPTGEYVSLKAICDRQDVSMKYLESIVSMLSKAGMLESLRGKNGGYRLSRKAEEYSLYSVLSLTEGTLSPVACIDCEEECTRLDMCMTRPMWLELKEIISDYLKSKTLADLTANGTVEHNEN